MGYIDVEYTGGQYEIIYNTFSLVIAAMGASTLFFLFQYPMVAKQFKTAMIITALVTGIACYHYVRIFNSFTEAYQYDKGNVTALGPQFNDAYRYVDWLLTVPLLLMELVLVMELPKVETRKLCVKLGSLAALMVILGYPGEVSDSHSVRWIFWTLAMVPFILIVYTLFVGLRGSVACQPEECRGLVSCARYVTVISWCTYPIVYVFPMLGLDGAGAATAVQIGYSLADLIAKPVMGIMVWSIASRKSQLSEDADGGGLLRDSATHV